MRKTERPLPKYRVDASIQCGSFSTNVMRTSDQTYLKQMEIHGRDIIEVSFVSGLLPSCHPRWPVLQFLQD